MEEMILKTIEEIRIYSDPYRMNILERFQKAERPSTVKEIADKMGEVPAKVYYHARKLERIGLIRLVNTKQINGITAKYYEAFKGSIQISRNEVDTAMQHIFMNETQKLLSDIYDNNKKKFLESRIAHDPSCKLINSEEIFLTEEAATEYYEWVTAFMNKHRNKTDETQAPYDIFTTIVKRPTEKS